MSVIVMAMVVLLIANLTYVQVVEGPSLRDDPRNPRLRLAETTSPRGEILAGDQVLASSAPTPGSRSYTRDYPAGPAFAPVTGYLSAAYGLTGLEQAESSVLDGSDPRLLLDHVGALLGGDAPQPGNVVTTIDPHVQQIAYQDMVSKGYVGAVVAIRPSTGAILAMVSTPSFDPNAFQGADANSAWSAAGSATPQVLSDRATSQLYPPGSTFKLVDLGAALQDGFTPDTPVTAASQITLPDTSTTLENYDGEHCGPEGNDTVPLSEALARSCNTAFATVADQVGADRLRDQARAFGVGGPDLSIPLPVVASGLGALADQASLAQSGIGQRDVRVTPLQNAEIVAAIANGGVRMAPHLVQQIVGADRSVIDTPDPTSLGRALPESVAATITQMMIGSEQLTSGHGDGPPGVTIASKTGTAEHGVDSKATPPHTWYDAFAPAQQPDVAVAVLVENGGRLGDDATGGSVASPIGRDVIAAALADAR